MYVQITRTQAGKLELMLDSFVAVTLLEEAV
jgi:hypothetical protein